MDFKLLKTIILTLIISGSFQTSVYAEKKYVFKPGSRQAVEVDTSAKPNGQTYRSMPGSTGGRVVRSGMSSSRYRMQQRYPATDSRQTAATGRARGSQSKSSSSKEPHSYHFSDRVVVDGLNRSYYVFVPSTYRSSSATPVMLVFHGLKMSAESMTAVTGFNGVAKRNNFIVVYCQSVGSQWNDGMKASNGVDDIKYVQELLKSLEKKVNIDRRHVFSVGLSNGGYFSQMLASSLPGQIAGFASVASTAMEQGLANPSSSKAVPAVFFIGTNDPLVNWADGKTRDPGRYGDKLGGHKIDPSFYKLARYGGWMSPEDMVNYWTKRNRCSDSGRVSMMPDKSREDGMRVEKTEYGSRGNAVFLYKIIGGQHSWPGALNLPGGKVRSCQDIEASELIWQFFRTYAW